jgi:hypothetical protein
MYHKNVLKSLNPYLGGNAQPRILQNKKIKQDMVDINFAIRNLNYRERIKDMIENISEKINSR